MRQYIVLLCLPVVVSVYHGENRDQQTEQIWMVIPHAFVGQKYVPVRNSVHGTTDAIVETH
jgi:hypothetical protein